MKIKLRGQYGDAVCEMQQETLSAFKAIFVFLKNQLNSSWYWKNRIS